MSKKVVIWGLPPGTHTHSYIHLGFAKAFSYLDYDVVWYDDDIEYINEDISDSIIITANICCQNLRIDDSSKYFVHNLADDFKAFEGDNIHNLLVYHENYEWERESIQRVDDYSWYDPETRTSVIMWATDLLPGEIAEKGVVLFDSSRDVVNYVGSLSPDYSSSISSIVSSKGKTFINYGGYSGDGGFVDDTEARKLVEDSYLNLDIRPEGHIQNGYIPCRIFKALSYGCWVGTNSEKILKFFDGRVTACEDLEELYSRTEEDSKKATKEILLDNKKFIEDNHTYINRVDSLLKVL